MIETAVIGTTFVDIKGFSDNKYDPQGRNLGDVQIVHGGVGRNVVENFTNVGMPVSFVGMLDDSAVGNDVKNHLLDIGADLSNIVTAPKNGMGMWLVILDEKGDLAGSISKIPDMGYLETYLEENGEAIIKEAETIILEIDLNEHITEMVINWASDYGKPVYSIVGNMSVVLSRKDLIRKTECFICNEVEAEKYFGQDVSELSIEELKSFLPNAVKKEQLKSMVVTLGERGAVYFDTETDTVGFCPPVPTEVVDTCGAGDAFFSGTVMAMIRGFPLQKAVDFGAKLASATISWVETTCPVDMNFFK